MRGRYFCRLELEEAIKLRKTIVLVHETDQSNGGYRLFGDYIDECMTECGQALARGELSCCPIARNLPHDLHKRQ